ncbi:hypothetical protein AB836_01615 [Rickettsiales bacterium (ex Bugula neritina AB1)]|nr:hypothetical protein AB836_01615 [Rickettsiales bacterium (ex Bugula neritina AB1)]
MQHFIYLILFIIIFFFVWNIFVIFLKVLFTGLVLFTFLSYLIPTNKKHTNNLVYFNSFNKKNYLKYSPQKILILQDNQLLNEDNISFPIVNICNYSDEEIKNIIFEWQKKQKIKTFSILIPRFSAFRIMINMNFKDNNIFYITYSDTNNPLLIFDEFCNFLWVLILKSQKVFLK